MHDKSSASVRGRSLPPTRDQRHFESDQPNTPSRPTAEAWYSLAFYVARQSRVDWRHLGPPSTRGPARHSSRVSTSNGPPPANAASETNDGRQCVRSEDRSQSPRLPRRLFTHRLHATNRIQRHLRLECSLKQSSLPRHRCPLSILPSTMLLSRRCSLLFHLSLWSQLWGPLHLDNFCQSADKQGWLEEQLRLEKVGLHEYAVK